MSQRIVYTREDGGVSVVIPAPEYTGTLEELAAQVVPAGTDWRVAEADKLPASRCWRDAWTDANPTDTVDVDFEKAKECHRALIIAKAHERVAADMFGRKDFATVQAELDALDIDGAADKETLFNLWPTSIEKRKGARTYVEHVAENA